MKTLFSILFFVASVAHAGTCTTTTRSNYNVNQILTSSALNADFNQLVTKANAFDGGCVTDGTLESGSLNSTDFAVPLNGITQGCGLTYNDANTITIDRCIASVNGAFVRKTSTTSVTWGCSGCSSEAASTTYYVYIKTGSSGSTINALISTSAPNSDGYDSSGNKVLGSFYNNASSAIDQFRIKNWVKGQYLNRSPVISYGTAEVDIQAVYFGSGASCSSVCSTGTCSICNQTGSKITSVTYDDVGKYRINGLDGTRYSCTGSGNTGSNYVAAVNQLSSSTSSYVYMVTGTTAAANSGMVSVICIGVL